MEHTFLLFFSFFIEAIVLWQYTSNFFVSNYSPKIQLIFLSFLYLTLFLFSLSEKIWLNMLLYFLANCVFLFTQFKIKIHTALFHAALLTAIMGISEVTLLGIISRFAPHFLYTSVTGLIFFTIFSKTLFFILVYLLVHLFKEKALSPKHYNVIDFFLMLIPISSIFILTTFMMLGESSSFIPPLNIMVIVSSTFLLAINLLVFGINQYNQKKCNEFTEIQLLLQKESDLNEYYEMLLSQSENQSILIHDIKKHLQSIELLNSKNESRKVSAYIRQLLDSSDLKESTRICDNDILNAILCRYQKKCTEYNISFHADIRNGSIQYISQYDLTSLFCNLLDNAIDSSRNIPDSFIEISVQKKELTPFIIIVMINSCRTKPNYNVHGFPISSKPNKHQHGFGIKSINKIVQKYQGDFEMYYENFSATFHTIITLKLGS